MFFEVTFPTLAPIILLVVLGGALQNSKKLPDGFFSGLNTLTFYIGLPALLLVGIATASIETGPALEILYVLVSATILVTILAYIGARLLKLAPPTSASFVQAAMRGNLAYIGLPVMFFVLEGLPAGSDTAALQAAAMLVLAPAVPFYNIACVIILARSAGSETGTGPSKQKIFLKVIQNPLLIACVIGLILSITGLGLPRTLVRTLRPLGQMALPLALFSIGASFQKGNLLARLGPATWLAAILKVALMPLVGLLLIKLFQVGAIEGRMALIFLACPTAVSSYVMAEQMGADAELAGSTVLLSTLLAMPALAVVLSLG